MSFALGYNQKEATSYVGRGAKSGSFLPTTSVTISSICGRCDGSAAQHLSVKNQRSSGILKSLTGLLLPMTSKIALKLLIL